MDFIESIFGGESKFIEYKEKFSKSLLKTVSAFSNFHDGIIIIGISDIGQVIGVSDPYEIRLSIENTINDAIIPRPDFEVQSKTIENKTVLIFKIYKGLHTPYITEGKAYRRADNSTVPVEKHEYDALVLYGRNLSFEELEYPGSELTFRKLEELLQSKLGIRTMDEDVLKSLELINQNKWINATALLADENNFIESGLDMVMYLDDKMTMIKDRINLKGKSLIEYFDASMNFYHKHINQGDIIRGAYRYSHEEVPQEAYREAIANAIIHRDYSRRGSNRIEIFQDRIEITSVGGLPIGISEEEFIQGTFSNVRNRIIADIFFRCRIIEKMGTGIRRIRFSYKDHYEKPIFKVYQNSIQIILPRIMINNSNQVRENETDLSVVEDKLLNFLKTNDGVTRNQVEEFMNVRKTKATSLLNSLLSRELVKKTGTGKNTRYKLKM